MQVLFGGVLEKTMNGLITMAREPDLSEIAAQDRVLVRNVIYTIVALNKQNSFCKEWHVSTVGQNYVVRFTLEPSYSVSLIDMLFVKNVSSQRIGNIIIQSDGTNTTLSIQVLKYDQPIVIYETDVIRVSKKMRVGT
jgi:hypothetical protein